MGYDADGKLVEPIKYASLYDKDEDGEVTVRAELWGIEDVDPFEPITMTRFTPPSARSGSTWSAAPSSCREHANHYYARDPLKPEMAVADYKVTSTEQTIGVAGRRRARRA